MTSEAAAPRFRFRLLPILIVIVLGLGLPFVAAIAAHFTNSALHLGLAIGVNAPWLYFHHFFQLVVALIAIAVVKRFVPGDYGLHLPRGKSYIGLAIVWGAIFGVVMTVVDYLPNILAHTAPKLDYPLTLPNIAAWMGFEGLFVGPTEEVPFRALLVTYLALTMPGTLRLGRIEMSWAGVIVAAIFALAHMASFWSEPWPFALGQQIYAFLLGVIYAYCLEKSRSVLAPAIGHNVSDGVEYVLLFLMVGFWPPG